MGYWSPANNPQIQNFTPDDGATWFHIADWAPLWEIIAKAKDKWGEEIDIGDICIESDYIHTHCLTYDRYDPGDYTRYLKIIYAKG